MRVFGIIGWKNSGKTGLMVRLISEITKRGVSVSTIKHAHHSFQLDTFDDDGQNQMPAGIHEAVFSSASRWSLVRENRDALDPPFSDLLARLQPVDLVLVEGYKLEGHPKIEAYRPETKRDPIAGTDGTILAVAATKKPEALKVPIFDLDATGRIADFILDHVGLTSATPKTIEHS